MKKVVIALGGNALQARGEAATSENQLKNVMVTAEHIAKIIGEGYKVIVSHGNGPQVGRILLQNEAGKSVTPPMPMDVCGAMTQGMIGYHIQQGLSQVLRENGIDKPVCTLVTQVEVDSADPAFQNPTKPVGAFLTEEEAKAKAAETGYTFKEDAGRGWRQVVASPKPRRIVESDAIQDLFDDGYIVVCTGGGGVPVFERNDTYEGVPAVIDKDRSAAMMAATFKADMLVILTAVEKVAINFNTPEQADIDTMDTAKAQEYIEQGQFAPGSMLPKVEACLEYVGEYPQGKALITSLDKAKDAINGLTGTTITE